MGHQDVGMFHRYDTVDLEDLRQGIRAKTNKKAFNAIKHQKPCGGANVSCVGSSEMLVITWCRRGELNPHGTKYHWILSPLYRIISGS